MNLLLKIFLALISPIYAHIDIAQFNNNPVVLQWQDFGQEYEYVIRVYTVEDSEQSLIYTSEWIDDSSLEIMIEQDGLYFWEVYIKENEKSCDSEHQCFKIETGYFGFYLLENDDTDEQEQEVEIEPEEEEAEYDSSYIEGPKESKTKEDEETRNNEEANKDLEEKEEKTEVLGTQTKKYIAKKEFREDDNEEKEENEKKETKKENDEHKAERNFCKYRYNVKKKKFTLKECNIDHPTISSSTYHKYNDQYVVNSTGNYQDKVKIYIENTTCKNFNLFDLKTWFRCEEIVMDSDEYTINLDHEVYFYNDEIISPSNYIFKKENFEIATVLTDLPTDLIFKGYFSIKHRGLWLDQELVFKKSTSFSEKKDRNSGVYSFPFKQIVYVNQWHGCTAYQCPHKGIDFAAIKENIYAGGNGKVVTAGYDTYSGECNSGGKYLVIKYENGHHMAYMHLDKIYVNNYQEVKDGDLIALSGNSGQHNCQPLGYHLHYELRKTRNQSTHIDPVPFIKINWNLVKTNKSNIFPKRLTGDNPHPSF